MSLASLSLRSGVSAGARRSSSMLRCSLVRAAPLLPLATSASAAAASSSPVARALHSSALRCGLFDKKEPDEIKQIRAQEAAMKSFWATFTQALLKPKFRLADYEEIVKLQMGAAPSDAGFLDRAKAAVRTKAAELQGGTQPGMKELKPIAAVLAALTAEEKDSQKIPSNEVKERVAIATGMTVSEVNLTLMRYDQFLAFSEWFRWRKEEEMDLPANHAQMQDFMKEDKREGQPFPRRSKLEIKLAPKKRR